MNKNDLEMLIKAFPSSLKDDVLLVSKIITNESYLDKNSISDNITGLINFTLSNGEILHCLKESIIRIVSILKS